MYDMGKTAQVTNEMRRNRLHVLGISKCRWTGTSYYKTQTGETTLYSGNNDNQHHGGVVLILRKGLQNSLMEWKHVSERLDLKVSNHFVLPIANPFLLCPDV